MMSEGPRCFSQGIYVIIREIHPGGAGLLSLAGFFWRLFELTGYTSVYLCYKNCLLKKDNAED